MKATYVLIASALLLCAGAMGQTAAPEAAANVFFWQQIPAPEPGNASPGPNVFYRTQTLMNQADTPGKGLITFIDIAGSAPPVIGAPYTAKATTETTQVLADGNRIVNKTSAFLARDGQGRTRREETMSAIGPVSVNMGQPVGAVNTLVNKTVAANGSRMVFINDPVSGVNYILDMNALSANVVRVESGRIQSPNASGWQKTTVNGPTGGTTIMTQRKAVAPAAGAPSAVEQERIQIHVNPAETGQLKIESLGTQVIEGVTAEGKVMTRTIPAGQIGNERPIEITQEVWTSPELQMVVLSKRSDPRFGETVYRLTDLKRGEPDHSLFEVPANFTVREGLWKRTTK